MTKSRKTQDNEIDPLDERNQLVDSLIGSSFQLSATGTIFTIGTESNPSWQDILFVLNRLYTTGYVEEFRLLPFNVEPEILISGLSKEVVAWLVPMLIHAIDRKVMGSEIDVLSPNNKNLVRLADVLGWYWYKHLHGPKPVINTMIQHARPNKLVQNSYMSCPLCFHQFIPAPSYKSQAERVHAFAKWLPYHFKIYHRLADTSKTKGSKCNCGFCTGKFKVYTANKKSNRKVGAKK
jgi:hypothetical protein